MKYGECWLGWLKDLASENISEAREPSFVLGYTHMTSFNYSVGAAGVGSPRAAGLCHQGMAEQCRGARDPKAPFPPSHPLSQWGCELFPPRLPKSLVVNRAIFLSMCVPAKNILKCVRGGQVIWAVSPTHFGE